MRTACILALVSGLSGFVASESADAPTLQVLPCGMDWNPLWPLSGWNNCNLTTGECHCAPHCLVTHMFSFCDVNLIQPGMRCKLHRKFNIYWLAHTICWLPLEPVFKLLENAGMCNSHKQIYL